MWEPTSGVWELEQDVLDPSCHQHPLNFNSWLYGNNRFPLSMCFTPGHVYATRVSFIKRRQRMRQSWRHGCWACTHHAMPLMQHGVIDRKLMLAKRPRSNLVLFCSLAVLDPRVGHTMNVLSPFISVLFHSDWLLHVESCPRIDVVHPGRAWSLSPACTWHFFLHYFFLQVTPLFSHSFLALTVSNRSLFTPAWLRGSTTIRYKNSHCITLHYNPQ